MNSHRLHGVVVGGQVFSPVGLPTGRTRSKNPQIFSPWTVHGASFATTFADVSRRRDPTDKKDVSRRLRNHSTVMYDRRGGRARVQ